MNNDYSNFVERMGSFEDELDFGELQHFGIDMSDNVIASDMVTTGRKIVSELLNQRSETKNGVIKYRHS